MRDKILTRAIIISVVLHLVVVSFIGRTSNSRLSAASMVPTQQRLLNFNLIKDPLSDPLKTKTTPAVIPNRVTEVVNSESPASPVVNTFVRPFVGNHSSAPRQTGTTRVANNAGGALYTGSADRNGDIRGSNLSGRTPSGWIPGSDRGRGIGSGSGVGVGNSEPPRVETLRHIEAPPPAPRRVTVRICEASGMLAGDYCRHTRNETYNEGNEPLRTCNQCKAPEPEHKSRLADQQNPILKHDVRPRIPDSLDEGLLLEVEIEYTVDADGGVSGIHVIRSSGHRDLDRAVESAASQWRYSPAIQDGVARRVKVSRVIRVKT